ncbi:hypothetical protein BASA81_004211 [Batrachochytrium salamandrivorans]|nr:hypothetical protein BASA81_004211 [Batrachochytrium salamandrivorans]
MRKSGSSQRPSLHQSVGVLGSSSQATAYSFPSLPGDSQLSSTSSHSKRAKVLDETFLFDGDITSTQNSAELKPAPSAPAAAREEEKEERPKKRKSKATPKATPSASSLDIASPFLLDMPVAIPETELVPTTQLSVNNNVGKEKTKKKRKKVREEEEEESVAALDVTVVLPETQAPTSSLDSKPPALAVVGVGGGTQTQSPPSAVDSNAKPNFIPETLPFQPVFTAEPVFIAEPVADLFIDNFSEFMQLDIPVSPPTVLPSSIVQFEGSEGEDEGGFFERVLVSCGVQMNPTSLALQVSKTKFTSSLRANLRGEDRIRLFLLSFQAHVAGNKEHINKCLLPLRLSADPSQSSLSLGSRDPSLIHVLLKIDAIQPALIDRLLELFLDGALNDDNNEDGDHGSGDKGHQLPKRILQSLCWLDFCCQPKQLTDRLLETLQSLHGMNSPWLADAVQSLPEILPDAFHGEAVVALIKILKETSTHSAAVLSCLADLTIPAMQLKMELVDTVLVVLKSKPLGDLPVIVTFLLSSAASLQERDKQVYILNELREGLAFLDRPPASEQEASNEALVVKEMINSLLVHPALGQCFLDVCKNKAITLGVVDVWLLIALSANNPQPVRDCIKQKHSQEEVFRKAIVGHQAALEVSGMERAMDLASHLVRIGIQVKDAEPIRAFGSKLLEWLFETSHADLRVRQELVHCILSHCCPGQKQEQEEEVGAALQCLDRIATALPSSNILALAPFSSYVRSLLNELDRFTPHLARILLRVVSRLTLVDGEGVDELKIFLRKYLMSSEVDRQLLGVVGTVQLASSLAPGSAVSTTAPRPDVREAMSLLDSMLRETKHPFTFDELARAIDAQELASDVVHSLHDTLEQAFEEWFLFDTRAPVVFGDGQVSLNETNMFGLEKGEVINDSAVKVLPLLSRGQTDVQIKSRLALLCPMLRCLLSTCRGNRTPDSLLSCPLVLPGLEHLNALNTRPMLICEVVCTSLVSACNWIREVLSSFSQVDDLSEDMQRLLVQRLGSLVVAERHLFIALKQTPAYCEQLLASTHHYGGSVAAAATAPARGRKPAQAATKPKPVKKKPKAAGEEEEEEDDNDDDGGEDVEEAEEVRPEDEEKPLGGKPLGGKPPAEIALLAMLASLRELSPHALGLLSVPGLVLVFTAEREEEEEIDTMASSPLRGLPEIHVSALKLVLESLGRHLGSHIVEKVAFGRRRRHRQEEQEMCLADLLDLVDGQAMPAIAKCFSELCLFQADANNSQAAKDSLICLELVLAVLDKLTRLYQQHLVSAEELLRLLKHFTLDEVTTAGTKGTLALPFVIRSVYQFLVQTTGNSEMCSRSLPLQVSLCSLLRDLVIVHNDLMDDTKEQRQFKDRLSKLCLHQLKQEWQTVKLGKANLGVLLDLYHDFSKDPLLAVTFTTGVMQRCLQQEPDVAFPALSTKTLPVFYSSAMSCLSRAITSLSVYGVDDDAEEEGQTMLLCNAFADCIILTKLDKISNPVLRDAIRFGRVFVDAFVKKQMPPLSAKLKQNQTFVMDVLGVVQKATRQLQNLCTHAKAKKDASILQATPALRRSLESLLCAIKLMLTENNLLEKAGFFVGVLKARNLNGSLVTKQVPV